MDGRLSVSYRKNGWNIDARYSLGYTNSSFVRTAFDNLTGLVDPVMTADYSRNYVSHSPMILTYYETALQRVVIDFSLVYDIEQMQNAEHASGSLPYGKTFAALLPGLGLTYSNKNVKLTFRITSAQELPSIEMLRNSLNTTNPYYLKAGNPLLDAPVSYNASLGYSNYFPKHTISITSELEAKLTRGAISSRTTYFNTPTTLAAYDNYVAPVGSQLNSYCNAGDAVDLRFKGTFSKGFSSIKMILTLTPQLLYNRTPSYFGDIYNICDTFTPQLGTGLRTDFSRKFKLTGSYNVAYIATTNTTTGSSEAVRQSVNALAQYDFGRCFVQSTFVYSFYQNRTYPINYGRNSLNVVAGVRLFHDRSGSLVVGAYDILNNAPRITTLVDAQSVNTTWNTNYIRFYNISFIYNFKPKQP